MTAASTMAVILGGSRRLMRWILRHPFLTLVVLLLAWRLHGEVMKAYWDMKVDQWCASEQTLQILVPEKIPPDPNRIGPMGPYVPLKPKFPAGRSSEYRLGDEYFMTWSEQVLRDGEPSVSRFTTEVFRVSTGEMVARAIAYGRGGGDFIAISPPSSHACGAERQEIFKNLFVSGRYS